jgi:hypothetical protein
MAGIVLFCAGVVVSLAASWLLVSRLGPLSSWHVAASAARQA